MKKIAAFLLFSLSLTACAQQKPGKKIHVMSSLSDTVSLTELGWFYKSLSNTIKYHPVARENQNTGKLIALFAIDTKRKVKYVKILKTPVDLLSDNVIDALKKSVFHPQ
jgi:pantothenate kinase